MDELSKAKHEVELWRKLFRVIGDFFRRLASGGLSPEEASNRLQEVVEGRGGTSVPVYPKKRDTLIARAIRYAERREYGGAVSIYEQLARIEPHEPRFLLKIGDLYLKQGLVGKAVESFLAVARFYRDRGFFTKALACYKQVFKFESAPLVKAEHVVCAHREATELYTQMGILPEASDQLNQLAVYLTKTDRWQEALAVNLRIFELGLIPESWVKSHYELVFDLCKKIETSAQAAVVVNCLNEWFKSSLKSEPLTATLLLIGGYARADLPEEAQAELLSLKGEPVVAPSLAPAPEPIGVPQGAPHNEREVIALLRRQVAEGKGGPAVRLTLAKLILCSVDGTFEEAWEHAEEVLKYVSTHPDLRGPSGELGKLLGPIPLVNPVIQIFAQTSVCLKYSLPEKARESLLQAFSPELTEGYWLLMGMLTGHWEEPKASEGD